VNAVDSSAWVEYFVGGSNAEEFAAAIEMTEDLVVPTMCVFEVFKRVTQLKSESAAMEAVGLMLQGRVVDLNSGIALEAARVSLEEGFAMADSIILATARLEGAVLWTQDAHFKGLEGVEFRAKE
jgi:predicted nucleic acid-binding protein